MSSSSYHSPPHLHRVNLHSHGKRPFEECGGYDSDMPIQQPTASGTSSSSNPHRFSTPASTETRNKRARSTSSTSTDDSSYNTAQSSSPSDLSVASPQVHMSDLHLPIPPRLRAPTPPMPEDTLRTSLQRFAEFDRQIAALRTSLAATRSPPLPPFGPSPAVDGSSNHHWHPNSSNFLSDGTSALASSNPPASTLDSFPSSNGQHATFRQDSLDRFFPADSASLVATTSASSASFTPTFGNLPRYPPSPYRPLVPHERMGETSAPPAIMRPSPNENARASARSSLFIDGPSSSHIRRLRGSLSPLAFPSDPPSLSPPPIVTDDALLRYPVNARSQRGGLDNPLVNQERRADQSAPSLHARPSDRARVIREHSIEREPVPTVFDVFSLADPSQNQSRPVPVRDAPVSRHASMADPIAPRPLGTYNRSPVPNQAPQDPLSRLNSSWASIPSSNSLMSESASERRHALALERFRARSRRSSFDADDESESRWMQDLSGESGRDRVATPNPTIDPSRSTHVTPFSVSAPRPPPPPPPPEPTTSMSLQRSFSELFSETERIVRDERADGWLLDWDTSRVTEQERQLREQERGRERERQLDRQRQRTWEWEWERQERGRLTSALSRPSTSLAREESRPPVPTMARPTLGPVPNITPTVATTTNNNQQYSYSNLNLSSFQSGLFRDSLRRNVEVDQASFSSSVVPSVNTGESRTASRIGFEDSESDMDLDDFVRTRPPSPEWSRPQPYAGRTPPPDYSPPPRNFSLRPGFAVWRRGSMVFDSQQQRQAFTSPVRPGTSGPTRPTFENNQRPAPERAERDRFLPARIFEGFHRSHGNASTAQGFQPNHTLRPDDVGVPRANGNGNRAGMDVGNEQRRGLGGSIRSRLARFTNVQSSAESATRPRLTSHPIGARPQTDQRRGFERVAEQRSAMGWMAEPAVVRDAPWRESSGVRGGFGPVPASTARNDAEVESRSRLRTLRQRFQLDRGEGMRVFRPGMLRAAMGRRGNMGDYVPDELFDDSYEALLSLSSMLGEVRSKATPEDVIASLPTGTFKEWKKDDSETRCPICLEDYEPSDQVTKLIECPHWLHKNCMEQWLRTANTCPVCREKVKSSPKPAPRRRPLREASNPPDGASNSRPLQANTGQGRPVSFAIVFDRMMNDANETWPSGTPGAFRERIREQPRAPPVQAGPSSRPVGFVSLLRGQGSDSSISTSSSTSMPMFPPPTPTVEPRGPSRAITTRLPIHEDSPSEEYMFGWHLER